MRKKLLRSTSNLWHDLQRGRGRKVNSERQSERPKIEAQAVASTVNSPFSDISWQAICELGEKLDSALKEENLPLSIGVEPTFVFKESQNKPEWNFTAVGEQKKALAYRLLYDLKQTVAPNSFIVYENGKWCPGENFPRWCFTLYWSRNQLPLINHQNVAYKGSTKNSYRSSFKGSYKGAYKKMVRKRTTLHSVKKFALTLKKLLKLRCCVIKTYLSEKPNKILGFMLPIIWDNSVKCWRIDDKKNDNKNKKILCKITDNLQPSVVITDNNIDWIENYPRIEWNHQSLCIFMPKTTNVNAYLNLLNTIEKVAEELHLPFILQGFGPPEDKSINKLSLTPDPGVLEINFPPVNGWSQMKELYEIIFKLASNYQLLPVKFNVNNEARSTGGGHHITLGGLSLKSNPFLLKPDLLQSLLIYWQHHPALSYLFSGDYIGETSQAPRIDQSHMNNLEELAIAFKLLSKTLNPSLEDIHKLFKNFLVDITGNPHRSEFCLDKFYINNIPYKMQGLLELRAFEMQPQAETNLLMILLVMCLVCRFWQKPYHHAFKRLEHRLQDEYLLPYFIWQDLIKVLHGLEEANFKFQLEWFTPIFEFKFPHYGTLHHEGVTIELRKALEFHPVLGQEMASGLSSRTVDPALERLQIKIQGLDIQEYCILCNQYEIPLQCVDDENDEYLAGIRFKARNPYITAHPTLPVHLPLYFNIINRHTLKSEFYFSFELNQVPLLKVIKNFNSKSNAKFNAEFNANKNKQEFIKVLATNDELQQVKKPEMLAEFPFTVDLRQQI